MSRNYNGAYNSNGYYNNYSCYNPTNYYAQNEPNPKRFQGVQGVQEVPPNLAAHLQQGYPPNYPAQNLPGSN